MKNTIIGLALFGLVWPACGGGNGGYKLPAGDKIKPFEEPEEDDLVEQAAVFVGQEKRGR